MPHRIVVNEVHMTGEVRFIPNRVRPKSPLPQRLFATGIARGHQAAADDIACNRLLIRRHRPKRSASSGGKVMIMWR